MRYKFLNLFVLLAMITSLLAFTPATPVYAATLTVNTLTDENDGSCVDGDCSLRDAIAAATTGDTITFSVTGTMLLTLGEMTINKNLFITGPGSSSLTLNANHITRHFTVNNGFTVTISGLTLTNGELPGNPGGSIANYGLLTLNNMVITGNKAIRGGAIFNNGILAVNDSAINSNTALQQGGGIFTDYASTLVLTNVTLDGNIATGQTYTQGGGIFIASEIGVSTTATLNAVKIINNTATDGGGGIHIGKYATVTVTDSIIDHNTASGADGSGGGGVYASTNGLIAFTNTTISNNTSQAAGGGITSGSAQLDITNSTISGNQTTDPNTYGAGIFFWGAGTANLSNVTISNNTSNDNAGGVMVSSATMNINNSTISNNQADYVGGIYTYGGTINIKNSIVANNISLSTTTKDCSKEAGGSIISEGYNLIEVITGCAFTSVTGDITGQDPVLGALADNGGSTLTMALSPTSPAIDAGNDATCASADQRGITRPVDGDLNGTATCDIGAFEYSDPTPIKVYIGGSLQGEYALSSGGSQRVNYAGVDSGPVKVVNTDGVPIIAAIRDAWAVNGVTTSFSQLMGLPLSQVSDKYVFPAYNNVTLNEQLRIGNVDTVPSTVTVTIGGVLRGTYTLQPSEAVRINYAGLDSGPVIVQGTAGVDIIAAIREAWAVNGVTKSFVQLMGLPASQLSNKYVFPAYNNVTLNEQLRIGNVDTVESTVTVTIGGVLRGTYTLQPNQAVRVNYAGLDSGPVVVEGTVGVDIIAAIRDAWAVNGVTTSFSQLMGMPAGQLSDQYLFPAYNNVTLNEQLRIGNVDTVQSTVTVTIGGVLRGTYTLQPSEAVRINYAGLDSGPVVVQGTAGVDIISAIRDAWAVNGVTQSFVQLMGLPAGQLSATYLFPAYNNVTLNEQLRIGMP